QFLATHDEAAFQAILRRHGPMVFRVCRRVLPQEQDAEDAFQATFLVLARQARTIRKQGSLASWLHGVAYRAALKVRARAARRRECALQAEGLDPRTALPDDVSFKEMRSLLDEELARLPAKLRAPLVLCYLEGLTQDEAAQQLGWTRITFRRNLERGRELLGSRLVRRGVTLSGVLFASLLSECAASAAVSPALLEATTKARIAVAQGKAAAVSARVLALADALVRTGLAGQWKPFVAFVLAAFVAGISGADVTRDARPGEPPPPCVPGEERVART